MSLQASQRAKASMNRANLIHTRHVSDIQKKQIGSITTGVQESNRNYYQNKRGEGQNSKMGSWISSF